MNVEPHPSLLQAFQLYIDENEICLKKDHLLVAVSGGIDSMVLVDLFIKSHYQIAIAHCNFQMRGHDSDLDQEFVRQLAVRHQVSYHTIKFDTRLYASTNKIGIQEAARNLRYTWFSSIMEEKGYRLLATAHHQDDQIETVLMNITRGTGIYGLQGMMPKRDHIIRPLLFARKKEIKEYAVAHDIASREDNSNAEDYYRRNYVRHKLIPDIEKRVPAFKSRMVENIAIWQKSARMLHGFLDQLIITHKKVEGDSIFLEIDKIDLSLRDMVAFEWLRPYGFNYSQVLQMLQSLEKGNSGKLFFSTKNRVVIDRKRLILSTQDLLETREILINKADHQIHLDSGVLDFSMLSTAPVSYTDEPNIAYLDAQTIAYPLKLRKWEKGDYFFPLGMDGQRQKLKKFFANEKYSRFDKEQQWLLSVNGDICWVIGRRIDHRFRITSETKYTLKITWKPT